MNIIPEYLTLIIMNLKFYLVRMECKAYAFEYSNRV